MKQRARRIGEGKAPVEPWEGEAPAEPVSLEWKDGRMEGREGDVEMREWGTEGWKDENYISRFTYTRELLGYEPQDGTV